MDSAVSILLRLKDEASAGLKSVAGAASTANAELGRIAGAGGDRAIGAVGSAAGRAAGAMDQLNPELALGARGLADAADVGEVASTALKGLGVSMGSILAISGLLVVALGALALVHHQLAEGVRDAEAAMKKASDTAKAFQDAHAKLEATAEETNRAWKLATGQVTELEAAWESSDAKIKAGYADQIRLQKDKIAQDKAELEGLKARIAESARYGGGSRQEHQDMVARASGLEGRLPAAERDLAGIEANEASDVAKGRAVIAITDAKKAAADAAAEAERRHAAAVAERAAAEAEADAAWKSSDSYQAFLYDTSDYVSTGASAMVGEARRGAAELDAYVASLEAAKAATAEWADKATADMAKVVAEMEALEARLEAQMQAAQDAAIGRINTASGMSSAAMSGDVAGLMSALGPQIGGAIAGPVGAAAGSAVAETLNGLSSLGQEGAQATLDKIDAYASGLLGSMEELPKLIDGIPERLPDIAEGIASAAPALFVELTKASMMWPVYLVRGMLEGIGQWWSSLGGLSGLWAGARGVLVDWFASIKEWLAGLLRPGREDGEPGLLKQVGGKIKEGASNAWDAIWSGSYDQGSDYVHRTGLAAVHVGERIVRSNGGSSGRTALLERMGGGGGGPQISVNTLWPPDSSQISRMGDELVRRFQSGATGGRWPGGTDT